MNNQRKSLILLFIISLVHLFIRIEYLQHSEFVIDADEAIVGLMAKHILEGAPIPTFYYGQHYMGSLESLLMSFVFSVAGVSAAALKFIPLFFSCTLLIVIYEIGRRIKNEVAGLLAALFYALPPQTLLDWGTKARGGFIEILFLGGLSILAFLEWKKTKSSLFLFGTGLILGIGWWVNNQIVFFMAPLGLFGAYELVRQWSGGLIFLRNISLALGSFFLGSLPFWIYNFKNNYISLEMFGAASGGKTSRYIDGFFDYSMPMLLGGRRFWSDGEVFSYSVLLSWILAASVFLSLLYLLKKSYIKNLLILFVCLTVLIFSFSSFGSLYKAPRYLLPLYVAWFPLLGTSVYLLWQRKKILAISLGLVAVSLQLTSSFLGGWAIPGEPLVHGKCRVMRNHDEVIKRLSDLGITKIRTDYWIGYKLAFETKEKITFIVFGDPTTVRIPSYEKNIEKNSIPFLISPCEKRAVKNSLIASDILFKEEDIGNYVLLYDLTNKEEHNQYVSPIRAGSTHNQAEVSFAFDGDIATRWGSKVHQVPGMVFASEFSSDTQLRGIKISMGNFKSDYPRGLSLEIKDAQGQWAEILPIDEFLLLQDRFVKKGELSIYFPLQSVVEARLVQQGSDSTFDWSIAELQGVR